MSGGKGGASPAGQAVSTQTNPLAKYVTGAADYLTPYAQDPTRPYTAPPNPLQTQGYYGTSNTANNIEGWPQAKAYDAYGNLITGGGTSPAYGGYAQMAAGGSGPQQTSDQVVNNSYNAARTFADPITGYANQAAGGNVGQDQLARVAQGDFLGTNPYSTKVLQGILDPIKYNFQTAISPRDDAALSGAGRYGSGAQQGIYRSSAQTLADQLGKTSEQFGFDQYKTERGQQDTAAAAYDQARRTGLGLGITGLTSAGGLIDNSLKTALSAADLNQRGQTAGLAGLTTGFNTGLTAQQSALQNFPQFMQSLFAPDQARVQAGAGLRDLDTSQLREPYDRVAAYLKAISGAGAGGSSTSTPYFTNPTADALSGISGALGIGKQLGVGDLLKGGLGGLGGSSAAYGGLTGIPLAESLFPAAAASTLPAYAAAGASMGIPELAATAGSAALWIVCTELMRQGKMPKRHYLAGWPVFAAYPERGKRGYYLWAIPLVRHLRKKPASLLSRTVEKAFCWRAEDIAARAGVKGARKLWRGRAVTAVLYPLCATLGWFVQPQDWAAVYRDEKAA